MSDAILPRLFAKENMHGLRTIDEKGDHEDDDDDGDESEGEGRFDEWTLYRDIYEGAAGKIKTWLVQDVDWWSPQVSRTSAKIYWNEG